MSSSSRLSGQSSVRTVTSDSPATPDSGVRSADSTARTAAQGSTGQHKAAKILADNGYETLSSLDRQGQVLFESRFPDTHRFVLKSPTENTATRIKESRANENASGLRTPRQLQLESGETVLYQPKISQGAFGKVHLGQRGDGSPCAVKGVNLDTTDKSKSDHVTLSLKSLRIEVAAMKQAGWNVDLAIENNSKGVPQKAFIIMDRMVCDANNGLFDGLAASDTAGRASRIAAMGAAMFEGHERLAQVGVGHADTKPDNVMIGIDGGRVVLRLGDMGLVAPFGAATGGTGEYKSPEQGFGGIIGEKSDVWSAGISMFEKLFGHKPSSAMLPPIHQSTLHDEIHKACATLAPGLPAAEIARWEKLLRSTMTVDPEARISHTEAKAAAQTLATHCHWDQFAAMHVVKDHADR